MAGCRSAQQFAKPSGNAKPAQQSAAQSGASAKKGTSAAGAKTGKDEKQLKTEAKEAASTTAQAASDLFKGLKNDIGDDPYPSSGEIVNINYASESRILTLPGINHVLAMKIIRNRPYATPTDLIAKHVLTKEGYDRIKTRLTAWDNLWTNPD
ncbi:MAG TPA: helix-hairpin-helix domain-containing protein [Acidobacteriaceae bacterium]|nr:helix-hairpin-helix domain-containing protein [Acidobacteriaceae bacterium]